MQVSSNIISESAFLKCWNVENLKKSPKASHEIEWNYGSAAEFLTTKVWNFSSFDVLLLFLVDRALESYLTLLLWRASCGQTGCQSFYSITT